VSNPILAVPLKTYRGSTNPMTPTRRGEYEREK